MKFDLYAYLTLARPVNCAIATASVLVGAGMAGEGVDAGRALLAGLSAACIAGGGNALNDACDEAADRINRPDRPIPSGRVSGRKAARMAVALFGIGAGLSMGLGAMATCMALAAIGGLVAYDVYLKRVPVVGNATVSGISGLALIYGGTAVSHAEATLVPAGFAFLFHLGREVVKDVEDAEGDAAVGAGSVAVAWGVRPALTLTTAVYLILIALTPVPFWQGLYDWRYIVLALCPVDAILFYVVLSMWRDRSRQNLLRLNALLKANMVFGLLALWVGRG
ncbi:MAG: geranylgeranylglycerol-phosphate geranylgeranyltransferase [Chloroflexi bacterium]|nr:geranylgeranylglycerol-phosphate geranylgeranyltransferase [Chloroflexota bacterium]